MVYQIGFTFIVLNVLSVFPNFDIDIFGKLLEATYRSIPCRMDVKNWSRDQCLQETAVERANEVFAALDLNEDGTLDEQEFVEGCMKDQSLAQLLNTGSTQLADADAGDQ